MLLFLLVEFFKILSYNHFEKTFDGVDIYDTNKGIRI